MLKHERWLVMFRVYVHLRIVFELMLHVLDCVSACVSHTCLQTFLVKVQRCCIKAESYNF